MAKEKGRGKMPLRRRTAGDFDIIRSFRMRTSTAKKFDAYCDRMQLSRAELLRRFVGALPTRCKPATSVVVSVV